MSTGRSLRRLRWLAAASLVLAALAACTRKPLQVVYYYKAGSPGLEANLQAVAALEQEFPGRVVTRSIEVSTAEAQRDLSHLEIGTSGLVVRNSNSVMILKQGESFLSFPRVRAAIRQALGMPAAP